MKTFAVIPAYNEAATLWRVVEQTRALVDQVVVVDDGSDIDLESRCPQAPIVHFLRHRLNLGKGAAMKTGVLWSLGHGADIIVFLDADGQHDPAAIPEIIAPIIARQADIVFGVRRFHQSMPLVARFGNRFLTAAIGWLFHIRVSDTQSGFRAFRTEVYSQLAWESAQYSVETEMIVNAGRHRLAWREVPIRTIYHDKYRGTTVIDGIRIFLHMIGWKLL